MKEWWEKESEYTDAYRMNRQAKNLWKYIPQKYREGVDNAFSDSDGYWVWLDENHVSYDGAEDCHIIHEYTITDLKEAVRLIRKIN